jgi:hypothetical protein
VQALLPRGQLQSQHVHVEGHNKNLQNTKEGSSNNNNNNNNNNNKIIYYLCADSTAKRQITDTAEFRYSVITCI